MFLITTADQRFWKTDEPILFLGEWCKLFSKKSVWEKLSYEVLPYHWDDCEKLYKDYLYLNDLYEKLLSELSKNLNKIHNVNHSIRYWRIIVGLWLLGFIYVFYDRYQSILSAVECGKVKNTLIIRADRTRYVPQDFGEFGKWAAEGDEYNYYLYSRIIEHMNRIPFEYIDLKLKNLTHINSNCDVDNNRSTFRKIVKSISIFLGNHFNRIVFVETYLSRKDIIRLQVLLNQIPGLVKPDVKIPRSEINISLRDKICLRSSDDKFEKLLMRMIPEQIPTLYIEDYANMNRISLKAYPRHPKVMFNAVAFHANEPFKFWAAYNIDRNVKLLGSQHGGLYGSGLLSVPEEHQIKIYNTFYTWGWKSDKYENTKPLAAAKLNTIKRGIRPKKGGRLLLVEMAIPRYSFIPEMFCTSSSGFLSYLDEQYRFVSALSIKNRESLLVRLYLHDHKWSQKERWTSKFPEIEICHPHKSTIDQLNESSLFIGTYNATTYLETFVANFPTILFWNPKHWELRSSAKPYFDELRKVGILYNTPEKAADRVNEISEDPTSWWGQPKIQAAKDEFCFQFARTSDNWLKEFRSALRGQLRT